MDNVTVHVSLIGYNAQECLKAYPMATFLWGGYSSLLL